MYGPKELRNKKRVLVPELMLPLIGTVLCSARKPNPKLKPMQTTLAMMPTLVPKLLLLLELVPVAATFIPARHQTE